MSHGWGLGFRVQGLGFREDAPNSCEEKSRFRATCVSSSSQQSVEDSRRYSGQVVAFGET